MKLLKKSLLYDISNLAYAIADTGEQRHTLHRVRDICQDGNIDRVSRVLGLAYSQLLATLAPILGALHINIEKDTSAMPHNYEFIFRSDSPFDRVLTPEIKLHVKELCHEYMVCMVLADWLAVTLPEAADVWKYRADGCLKQLEEESEAVVEERAKEETLAGRPCRRRLSPF